MQLLQENFLPLIDMFHKESVKVEVCKSIIEGFSAQNGPITDPIIINALMFLARIIHDSVRSVKKNRRLFLYILRNSLEKCGFSIYNYCDEIILQCFNGGRRKTSNRKFNMWSRSSGGLWSGLWETIEFLCRSKSSFSEPRFGTRCACAVRKSSSRRYEKNRTWTSHEKNISFCQSLRSFLLYHDSLVDTRPDEAAIVFAFGSSCFAESVSWTRWDKLQWSVNNLI